MILKILFLNTSITGFQVAAQQSESKLKPYDQELLFPVSDQQSFSVHLIFTFLASPPTRRETAAVLRAWRHTEPALKWLARIGSDAEQSASPKREQIHVALTSA